MFDGLSSTPSFVKINDENENKEKSACLTLRYRYQAF